MKKKQNTKAKKARQAPSRRRPLHRRVLLHPISVFLLLCVGVLVIGATLRGAAASYDVTATVPAPIITTPAVIQQPTDGFHTSNEVVGVSGSCPGNSYVKLYRGSTFVGVSICVTGSFSVQTELLAGSNELKAQVFNLTDIAGPEGAGVTVYYDSPAANPLPPRTSLPTSLGVYQVDEESYRSGTIREVGANPIIRGLAPPFSFITVTFYSDPLVCKTQANASGLWSCAAPSALQPGTHHVQITAVTPSGKHLSLPRFAIWVGARAAAQLTVQTDYRYLALRQGQTYSRELVIEGGRPPYRVEIKWGDGKVSHVTRQDSEPFTIEHIYKAARLSDQEYTILIKVSDDSHTSTVLQLTAAVRDSAVLVSGSQGTFAWLMDGVHRWLWVAWPAYIVVVLMVLSFWIGEREVYSRLTLRRTKRPKAHAGRR